MEHEMRHIRIPSRLLRAFLNWKKNIEGTIVAGLVLRIPATEELVVDIEFFVESETEFLLVCQVFFGLLDLLPRQHVEVEFEGLEVLKGH